MNNNRTVINYFVHGIWLICLLLPASAGVSQSLRLWYNKPASQWVEALPVGNGHIGGMIFGGVEEELIQLNESKIGRAHV